METIPYELLLSILEHVPDLSTLHCLVQASPAASRVFDSNAAQVIESALTSGALHKYTCAVIRIAAHVRCGIPLPNISGMDDFDNFYRHETTELRYDPPRWKKSPLRLAPATTIPVPVLRSILATHCRLESRMAGCLAAYLARFRTIQPMHLVDQDFMWKSHEDEDSKEYTGAWQLQPAFRPFVKHDIGPPTWCEEQRVLRALWRVQLAADIRAAGAKGLLEDYWPSLILIKANELHLYDGTLSPDDGALTPWIDPYFDPIQRPGFEPELWKQMIQVEDELTASVVDYTRNIATPSDLQQHMSRDWPVPIAAQQDLFEVECSTSAMAVEFEDVKVSDDDLGNHELWHCWSPLQHVPWDFYRRRGFAIWCEARLLGYGLLSKHCFYLSDEASRTDAAYPFSSVAMAWKSVLTEDELAEVERRNKRHEDEWRARYPRSQN